MPDATGSGRLHLRLHSFTLRSLLSSLIVHVPKVSTWQRPRAPAQQVMVRRNEEACMAIVQEGPRRKGNDRAEEATYEGRKCGCVRTGKSAQERARLLSSQMESARERAVFCAVQMIRGAFAGP